MEKSCLGLRVHVLDTSHLEDLLGGRRGDNAGTAGRGDETHVDRANLTLHLARHGVRFADLVTPVATAHGDNSELGNANGSLDGVSNFLGDPKRT